MSVPYPEENRTGGISFDRDPEHIAVPATEVDGRLPPFENLETSDHIAQFGGGFKLQVTCRCLHLCTELSLQGGGVPRENRQHFVDRGSIVFPALKADARSEAPINVVIEARSIR
ncbi:MAG: hypothetical protein P8125_13315 [Gemmatimonadota bacterium]